MTGVSNERLPSSRPENGLAFDPRRVSPLVQRGVNHLAGLTRRREPVLIWSFRGDTARAGASLDASLWGTTVADNMVYVNRSDGFLCALDVATGTERWTLPNSGESFHAFDGQVFVVPEGEVGHLVALDAKTGRELWRSREQVASSYPGRILVTVAEGSVYAYDDNHILHAYDAATGRQRWRFQCPDFPHSAPLVVGDVVLANVDSIVGVDVASGLERWRLTRKFLEMPPPLAAWADIVYQVYAGVLALDLADGSTRWSAKEGSWLSSTLVAEGLFCTSANDSEQTLVALDAVTGTERWRFLSTGNSAYPVAAYSGTIFVEDAPRYDWSYDGTEWTRLAVEGLLQAVDATTGDERWRFPGRYLGSSHNHVYVGGWDGSLHALDLTTGTEWWRLPIRDIDIADVVHGTVRQGDKVGPATANESARYWTLRVPYLGPDEFFRWQGIGIPAESVHVVGQHIIVTTGHTLHALSLGDPRGGGV